MSAWLLDPLAYGFMQRALLAAALVGVVAPLVGTWIVLRRLAYLGDAMGHASIAGVAAAYLLGASVVLGALAAGLVMAALLALLAAHPRIRADAAVAAAEVALFATGVLVIAASDGVRIDLSHILFGSITTVAMHDLVLDGALAAAVLATLVVLGRDLRDATFDPVHAALVGIRPGVLGAVLLALLAIAVVIALQTVGLLMSIALLVLPPTAARLWTRTVLGMSVLAAAIGVVVATGGLIACFHLGTPPGATIALGACAVLAASVVGTWPRRARRPYGHLADARAQRSAGAEVL